uniref:Mediator of RNA polymerase II transcription subunit 29 n=1 Tax=Nothoprocta perdicaria TaxID=30464 RepID=A0A8C6Z8V6_NOTPE
QEHPRVPPRLGQPCKPPSGPGGGVPGAPQHPWVPPHRPGPRGRSPWDDPSVATCPVPPPAIVTPSVSPPQTLMKVAAQNLVQNSNIDNGQKSADGALQRFDKSLEEFYALCDQLELCLRLAHECLSQSFDSTKHSPTLVPTATKPEAGAGESLPYTQYLPLIKAQIAGAKDIHNALLEGANKITGKLPPPGAGHGGDI